jgi:hypothetical protein
MLKSLLTRAAEALVLGDGSLELTGHDAHQHVRSAALYGLPSPASGRQNGNVGQT